jgi:hypothetical protein
MEPPSRADEVSLIRSVQVKRCARLYWSEDATLHLQSGVKGSQVLGFSRDAPLPRWSQQDSQAGSSKRPAGLG